MNKEIKSALVLEDNELVMTYLCDILQECFNPVDLHQASTLKDAQLALTGCYPDLALIDMHLPDGSGVEILKQLESTAPDCVSVVITAHDMDEYLFSALQAGAQGYLLKSQKRTAMVSALQSIRQGHVPLSPSVTTRIIGSFARNVSDTGELSLLSTREIEVLTLIAQGNTAKQIAEKVSLSYHTINSHIKNIYNKLEISCRAEAVQKAAQLGLMS